MKIIVIEVKNEKKKDATWGLPGICTLGVRRAHLLKYLADLFENVRGQHTSLAFFPRAASGDSNNLARSEARPRSRLLRDGLNLLRQRAPGEDRCQTTGEQITEPSRSAGSSGVERRVGDRVHQVEHLDAIHSAFSEDERALQDRRDVRGGSVHGQSVFESAVFRGVGREDRAVETLDNVGSLCDQRQSVRVDNHCQPMVTSSDNDLGNSVKNAGLATKAGADTQSIETKEMAAHGVDEVFDLLLRSLRGEHAATLVHWHDHELGTICLDGGGGLLGGEDVN